MNTIENQPKTVQIFLPEGNANGIKVAEITSRTVQATLIPRNQLNKAESRSSLQNPGIYFLFGEDSETEEKLLYIGESENVFNRLKQHNKSKDFWDTAVLIVSNNESNNFTKAEIKFMENVAYMEALDADRFKLDQTIPVKSFVPEYRQYDLMEFLNTTKILLTSLNYPVYDQLNKSIKEKPIVEKGLINSINVNSNKSEYFYIKYKNILAKSIFSEEGLVVLKDSEMVLEAVPSFATSSPKVISKIKSLKDNGTLIEKDNKLIFTKDFLFKSPSAAATLITQRKSNGWIEWKNKENKSLNDIFRNS